MCMKLIKWGVLGSVGCLAVGGVLFGTDLGSYVHSSAHAVRDSVKSNVPIEFELKRARDTLQDIIPEIQANVRLIASEEVEVANLKEDIAVCEGNLKEESLRIAKLRDLLDEGQSEYRLAGFSYSRDQVKGDLASRFDRFKEAELIVEGKRRLLANREKSLRAAMSMLDKMRSKKVQLEDQIESLESQYRLVQAASVGSQLELDNSALARTEALIDDIKNRLDVAERVLSYETHFTQPIEVDVISERELIEQVDAHFAPESELNDEPVTTLSQAD